MTSPIFNLYHVTTYDAMKKILDGKGIDPALSQGKRPVAWYVSRKLIPLAISHVIQRHECELVKVCILHVKAPINEFQKASRVGIYCTLNTYQPIAIDSAALFLQREEHSVYIKGARDRRAKWYGPQAAGVET